MAALGGLYCFDYGARMPTIGEHETTQRLHLSGVGGLYALQSDEKKVIKILQPPQGIWSERTLREEIDGFLLRYKTQRAAAKASANWAPVHEVGAIRGLLEGSGGGAPEGSTVGEDSQSTGAYAIMDRYERSVRSLLDGRVNLTNDDLRNIMSGVARGLADLKKLGRAHGNLKPSNILLADSADLATAKIFLADPAPDGVLTKDAFDRDLSDLAKILFQLVNLRPYDGGTIPKTREWTRLGPNGEDWRKLCNALLDPHESPGERDLEKIVPMMASWTARPPKRKAPALMAASILFVVIVGGLAAWYFTRPPKLNFSQDNWEKLCLNYAGWFGEFSSQMSDDAVKRKYASAPYPGDVVKAFSDYAKFLDKISPQTIAVQPSDPLNLAVAPTQDAKTGYGPYYTQEGDKLIDAVEDALTPAHWQVLQQLDKTQKEYDQRGWGKPAAGIRAIIDGAKPPALPPKSQPLAERVKLVAPVSLSANIEKTIRAASTVREIDAGWARVQEDLKALPQGAAQDVPLIKALPQFAQDLPKSQADPAAPATLQDVTSLSASFKQIDDLIRQVSGQLSPAGKQIDYAELARDPGAQLPAGGAAALKVDSFKTLPEIVPGYVMITAKEDPTKSRDWQKEFDDVQKNAITVIQDANGQDQNLPKLKEEYSAVAAMKAAWEKIPAIEKNRADLARRASEAEASLNTLKDNANAAVAPYIIDPKVYLAQQRDRLTRSPLAKATPVIYAAWKGHQNALIDKLAAAGDAIKHDYHKYLDFDQKFNGAEKAFQDLDASLPATVPELAKFTGNDWKHAIAAHVLAADRENVLGQIIAALKWTDDTPQTAEEAFVSTRTNLQKSFAQTCSDAASLIGDYSTIQDRLDHLDLLPNEPAAGAKSWRELYSAWQQGKNPLMADEVVVGALKPISNRVTALLALDTVDDYKELIADTGSTAPEIVLASWRKLGAAPVTEALPVLDDEDKAEAALLEKLTAANKAGALTNAHLQSITTEIAAQRPIRWRHWAQTLASPAGIQTALDKLASFRITLTADTDPAMYYNASLYALRKEFEKNPKEAELKPIAQSFINNVHKMPATVNADPDIQDLLARAAKSLTQSQEESSSAGAGPKLAGWEQETPAGNDAVRLFYFPSKAAAKYTLEFDRMQVGNKTVFLCTTEMPFGLFANTLNSSGKFGDIDNSAKPSKEQHWMKGLDTWDGPLIWKIVNRQFTLNTEWLFKVPQMGDNSYYPAGAASPPPSADLPMNYVTPWTAMYAARLLGCRLPTTDEWKTAYDKFEAGNTQAPKDAWNLRGAAWNAQQEYAKTMAKNGMKYADAGIYLPYDLLFDPSKSAEGAKPWKGIDLAKIAPNRITPSADIYKTSVLWFRKVGTQPGSAPPGAGTGAMHDLVGNIAEYVFDGSPDKPANAVIKNNTPSTADIDAAIATLPVDAKGKKQPNLFVIGGSSLSPPEMAFNVKQEIDPNSPQTEVGFCDVGFRLAYTAPIDSIVDVLAAEFKSPHYLPGPKAKRS